MSEGPLNLDDFGDLIQRPNARVRRAAEARRARTGLAPGALGRLDDLGRWLSAAQGEVPVRPIAQPRLVLFAGDHGVAERGVSARPAGSTRDLVRAVLEGTSPTAVLARGIDVPVRVADLAVDCDPADLPADVTRYRVRRGSDPLDVADALSVEEAERAFRAGMAIADEEVDSGTDLLVLGDLSVGGTTAAGVLIAALCGTDASVVTGRGGVPVDDLTWMRKCAAVRDGLRRARPVLGDQLRLLATSGGADLAAATGFLLQAAARRTPVLLDGVVSAACALVGQRIAFRGTDWWLPGQATGEPAQAKALDRMAMKPLLDHRVAVGAGAGALLALPLVRSAAALAAELPEQPEQPEPRDDAASDEEATAQGAAASNGEGPPPREAASGGDAGTGASGQAERPAPAAESAPEQRAEPSVTHAPENGDATREAVPGGDVAETTDRAAGSA